MEPVAFWREKPLTPFERDILAAVFAAHAQSAMRDNVSKVALRLGALGSRDYTKALSAALSTLGGPHAPIAQTYDLLSDSSPALLADSILQLGGKVPGWGNSFVKGAPDPIWERVEKLIRACSPRMGLTLNGITTVLRHKNIHPNPSAYTAGAAIVLGIPKHLAPWLFVAGRLNAWTEILGREVNLWV